MYHNREFCYPNEAFSVALARREVSRFAAQAGVEGIDLADLVSAVGEALANAVQHGCRPGTNFYVRCGVDAEKIVVEVEDEGPGFVAADSQGRAPGNGFTIMMCLVDRVSFDKNGRV